MNLLKILWLVIDSAAFAWTCVKYAWFVFWEPAFAVLLAAYLLLLYTGFKLINKLHYGGR